MTDQTGGMTLESKGFSPAPRIMWARVLLSQSAAQMVARDAVPADRSDFFVELGADAPVIRVLGEDDAVPFEAATLGVVAERLDANGIDLVLTDESSIDLTFDVPPGLLPEVRQMIDTELQYRSPFAEGAALAIWEAFEAPSGGWTVKAALTLKDPVEKLVAALDAQNISVGSVIAEADGTTLRTLPPWQANADDATSPFAVFGALSAPMKAALAGAAIFALSATAYWGQTTLKDWSLTSEASLAQNELRNTVAAATRLRGLDASLAMSTEILALTGEMSKLLPDEVFLDQLIVDNTEVTFVGFAPSAAEVTRIMSTLPTLTDIKFASPVIRDNSQSIERFRIAATLVPGGAQ